MAVLFRAQTTTSSGGSPRTVNKPTGTAAGDLLILHVALNADIAPTSVPDGFTLISGSAITGTNNIRLYAKVATGSEPDNYSVTYASGNGTVGLAAYYSDAALSLGVNAIDGQSNASGDRLWPSIITTLANTLLLFYASLANSVGSTPPGSASERYDTGTLPRIYLMTEAQASAGASGTRTATGTATTSRCVTVAVGESNAFGGAASLAVGAVTLTAAGKLPIGGAATLTLGALALSAAGVAPPPTPQNVTATPLTSSSIVVSWEQMGTNFEGFSIERSPNGETGWTEIDTVAADARSYTDTGLDENAEYFYRMRSFREE